MKKTGEKTAFSELREFLFDLINVVIVFAKQPIFLTSYWLTLSLNRRERVSLPIVFGERRKQRIEEASRGKWQFTTVEMVKRNGKW